MSSVAPTKVNDLFSKIHVSHLHEKARSFAARMLDNRVTALALTILSKAAAVLAVGASITAAVLTGFGSIPFVFVGGCLLVHAVCHFVAKKMHRLFNPDALRKNQQQAEAFVLSLKFLSEVAISHESSNIGEIGRFITPLSSLIEKYTASDLIAYKILSSSCLIEAFVTEVAHKDFSSSLALYQTIFKAIEKKGLGQYSEFSEKVLPILKDKANKLMDSLPEDISDVNIDTFSQFYDFSEDLALKFKALKQGIEAGVMEVEPAAKENLQLWFQQQHLLVALKNSDRTLKPVKKLLEKKQAAIEECNKLYSGHDLHDVVEAKQKEFIASLELIYINKKQRDDKILADHVFNITPIEAREEAGGVSPEDVALKEDFIRIKDKKLDFSLDLARTEMETLVERHVGDDFIATNQQLEKVFAKIERRKDHIKASYQAGLEKVSDADHFFKVKYKEKIDAFKELTQATLALF